MNMKRQLLLLVMLLAVTVSVSAQKKYNVYAVGFYNLENLFDTCHDEGKNDYDFLPNGSYKWNALKYNRKLHNMAMALSEMGTDMGNGKLPIGCAIIGVSEVENSRALSDLVAQPELAARGYDDLYYIPSIRPAMRNCSFNGKVFGCEGVGGLLGGAYKAVIENVYGQCEIYPYGVYSKRFEGGLIGDATRSTLRNGYAKTKLNYEIGFWGPNLSWCGIVIGLMFGGSVQNIYYDNNDIWLPFASFDQEANINEIIVDTSAFVKKDSVVSLVTPVTLGDSLYCDMLDALNAWVVLQNNPSLRLWKADSAGFPIFGDFFVPSCYTPDNIRVEDFTKHQDSTLIKVSWSHQGNPSYYEVKFSCYGKDTMVRIIHADSTPCFITGLPIGDISVSVRAVCDGSVFTPWC